MRSGDALGIMLCLLASGCAGLQQPAPAAPLAGVNPPDHKKIVELVNAAFKTAKLSGTPEASPVHPTHAPQLGDWMMCIKGSADALPKYAVLIKDGAVVDVRTQVLLDRCDGEAYSPVEITSQPAVNIDSHGSQPGRRRHP
jgi:hypothetical protein